MDNQESIMPELILDIGEEPELSLAATEAPKPEPVEVELNEQEQALVRDFASKINITDSTQVLQYGIGAQKKVAAFSESALSNVRGKDIGEVGEMITGLVTELKSFEPDSEKKGILGFFKKTSNSITAMKAKYDSVEKNVDKIASNLESHKMTLMKDVAMLDKMYEMNLLYYKELSMYIFAGKQKLKEVMETELPALREKAAASGTQEDAQKAGNLNEMCNRFEKKLHDLDLTRTISMQMAPQIRLVQQNNSVMIDRIQSSIVNTIPLWKNQMVLTLGLQHSQDAITAQRHVTDTTNELLRKNADMLKMSTIETAREAERGIVDIETLQHTNESLISTLDEVLLIQKEGRDKRRLAEAELRRIENNLKNKLLEVRN